MEDDFGISGSTDANVCACRRHHADEEEKGEQLESSKMRSTNSELRATLWERKNKAGGRFLADAVLSKPF
jgi:hypothetical protein